MHAVIITFRSSLPLDQLAGPFTDFANALTSVDGFVSKTWLHDGETLGGSYVFKTEAAAKAYLASPMVAELTATEGFDDFEVLTFSVVDELTALTTPSAV